MHGRPRRRWLLHRRRLAGREQQPFEGRVVAIGGQRRRQPCQLGTGYVVGNAGGGNIDDAGDFPLGTTVLEMQPQNFMDFAHG